MRFQTWDEFLITTGSDTGRSGSFCTGFHKLTTVSYTRVMGVANHAPQCNTVRSEGQTGWLLSAAAASAPAGYSLTLVADYYVYTYIHDRGAHPLHARTFGALRALRRGVIYWGIARALYTIMQWAILYICMMCIYTYVIARTERERERESREPTPFLLKAILLRWEKRAFHFRVCQSLCFFVHPPFFLHLVCLVLFLFLLFFIILFLYCSFFARLFLLLFVH